MTDDTRAGAPDDIRALLVSANPVPPEAVAGLAESPAARAALDRILTPAPARPRRRFGLALVPLVAALAGIVVLTRGLLGWLDGPLRPMPPTPAMGPMAPVANEVFLPDLDGSPRMISSCASPAPGVTPSPGPPLPDLTGYPPAGPVLAGLSRTAERQLAPERRPEERYSRIRTAEWSTDVTVGSALTATRVIPREIRRWVPVDGSGTYVERDGAGLATLPPPTGVPWAAAAPEDLDGVRSWLLGESGERGDIRLLGEAVARVYRYNTVSPHLAGLIWQVLAERAELRSLGEMADRWRRAGTAIAFDLPGERWVLLAAPETGRLLALERVLLTADPTMNVSTPCSAGYFLLDSSTWTAAPG